MHEAYGHEAAATFTIVYGHEAAATFDLRDLVDVASRPLRDQDALVAPNPCRCCSTDKMVNFAPTNRHDLTFTSMLLSIPISPTLKASLHLCDT